MLDPVPRIASKEAVVGIIGLGYVGLPLLIAVARAGFRSVGLDTDATKPERIARGVSYIDAVSSSDLNALLTSNRLSATTDFARLDACDVIVICVPTPLTRNREPDMSHIEATARSVAAHLRPGQTVILESTSYPGTTREVLKPILEATGLLSGVDFFLGFSPEREDPGNRDFSTTTIPKVVSGEGPLAQRAVEAFYAAVVDRIVPVSSVDTAEAVKITENVFRAVNIALVNELKVIFDRMGIDIWEVIEAAKTKPFGFMPFYPGPGLGGHCIPIDPFYLAWKSREFDLPTRFIELAGEINLSMPRYVIGRLEEALDRHFSKSLSSARVLLIGLAYKKNVGDVRESPSFRLLEILEGRGVAVNYHDPHVPVIPNTREHPAMAGRASIALDQSAVEAHDAVLIATDHDSVNYGLIARHAKLVVDTRNALGKRSLQTKWLIRA